MSDKEIAEAMGYRLGEMVEVPLPDEWKSGNPVEPVTLAVTKINQKNKTVTVTFATTR